MNAIEFEPITRPPAPTPHLGHYLLAVVFALLGGVLGIAGAFVVELRSGGYLLVVVVAGPMVEELLKPAGIYIYLARWPFAIISQPAIAGLTALSGLVFGLLESLVYVQLYSPDAGRWFFVYRFTVPLLVHATASGIAGFGVNTRFLGWAAGRNVFPPGSRNAFGAAIALHALYNTTAVALAFAGVLDFD